MAESERELAPAEAEVGKYPPTEAGGERLSEAILPGWAPEIVGRTSV